MSEPFSMDRREFLQTGAAVTAAATLATGAAVSAHADDQPSGKKPVLPTRVLGKTGVEVTILNQGTVAVPGFIQALFRQTYAGGCRFYDTAKVYGGGKTELEFKSWFEAMPEVRKTIFLATKQPTGDIDGIDEKAIDERLERLGTDYIDLIYYHGIGPKFIPSLTDKALGKAVDKIKKTGKVKFVGVTTHDGSYAEQLAAAAKGNMIDVIMLKWSPWITEAAAQKALDACHKAGIGLISMKQINGNTLKETDKNMPKVLKERSLKPAQGLLQAIWTDDRFTNACVTMMSREQVAENLAAARGFKPFTVAEIHELRDAVLAAGRTMCPDCDGRCARAAGTDAALGDLARFYTYHEQHGARAMAREHYAELTDAQRDWSGADLEAARAACPSRLDFARILPEADRLLG